MHEWALAEAVVAATLRVAREERFGKVTAVTVGLGELQNIDPDIFETALHEIGPRSDPLLKAASFRLQVEPVRFHCRRCGMEWRLDQVKGLTADELESIHFIPEMAAASIGCPACSSPDFEIQAGRGVRVTAVTGEA